MRLIKIVKVSLGIAIVVIIVLGIRIVIQNDIETEHTVQLEARNNKAMGDIVFNSIHSKLVLLEGSINVQEKIGWTNEQHVTEEIINVQDGITFTLDIGKTLGALDKEQEKLLWALHHDLTQLKQQQSNPNVTERHDYYRGYANKLRSAGWAMGKSIRSNWESFERNLTVFLENKANHSTEASSRNSPKPEPIESNEPRTPIYMDEGTYKGDELEIIQLMNLSMKHVWEGNEKEYLKLMHEDSPLANIFPSYKLEKIILTSEITIREQKRLYEAVVSVVQYRSDEESEAHRTYVFSKGKEKGAKWTIRDID